MIYVFKELIVGEYKSYMILDTELCSLGYLVKESLVKLSTVHKLLNASIINNEIVIENERIKSHDHELIVVLTNYGAKNYLAFSPKNKFIIINEYAVMESILSGNAFNVEFNTKSIGCHIKIRHPIDIKRDIKFESKIKDQYNKYELKASLIGSSSSFKYKVIGHEVILTEYKGNSVNVVTPKFITCIAQNAFISKGIESIKFNTGLKYIGAEAFWMNELYEVEIPETVECIMGNAFYNNAIAEAKVHIKGNTVSIDN